MSFLDFSGVYEPESVPAGEYKLRVLVAEVKQQKPEKGSGSFIQLKMDIPGSPKAKDITHVMMLPGEQDDQKQRNSRLAAIQNFLKSCGYDNVNNIDEVIGANPWAILVEEETTDFGKQNRVRKFVIGQ